jgi:hypothetical protein
MTRKILVLALSASCLLPGQGGIRQKVQITKTDKMDFPANGTLRVENSTGELDIEGWDEPGLEITTTVTSADEYPASEREQETKKLDRVQVSAKRNGEELIVTSAYPRHRAFPWVDSLSTVTNFDLEYHIKVPRHAKIVVKHEDGNVYVNEITGNVDVKTRQGLIALRLIGDAPPAIEAKSELGSVSSDYDGKVTGRPWLFGHSFVEGTTAAQNLHLKIGFGDIIILKAHEPQAPRPLT